MSEARSEPVTCHMCHKPLTARGNRQYWIRNNRSARIVNVCGRDACTESVHRSIQSGDVYSYESINQAGERRPRGKSAYHVEKGEGSISTT